MRPAIAIFVPPEGIVLLLRFFAGKLGTNDRPVMGSGVREIPQLRFGENAWKP